VNQFECRNDVNVTRTSTDREQRQLQVPLARRVSEAQQVQRWRSTARLLNVREKKSETKEEKKKKVLSSTHANIRIRCRIVFQKVERVTIIYIEYQ
jgi:hypothetical protein